MSAAGIAFKILIVPSAPPIGTLQLLARAAKQGPHIGTFCQMLHQRQGEPAIRRIQGVLSFHKRHGVARVDEACGKSTRSSGN